MGKIILEEQSTPADPLANKVALYPKAGGEFYRKNDIGDEDQIMIISSIDLILCHNGDVITYNGNVVTG